MHTTSVLGIGKVFTTALLSLQAKSVLTPGQPVAAKRFFRDARIRQVGLGRKDPPVGGNFPPARIALNRRACIGNEGIRGLELGYCGAAFRSGIWPRLCLGSG